jgi:hypothetical protein
MGKTIMPYFLESNKKLPTVQSWDETAEHHQWCFTAYRELLGEEQRPVIVHPLVSTHPVDYQSVTLLLTASQQAHTVRIHAIQQLFVPFYR